jgi:hypothetical protein
MGFAVPERLEGGMSAAPEKLRNIGLDHPDLRRTRTAPERASPPMGLGHFQGLSPFKAPPGNAPSVYSKPGLFTLGALPPSPFPRCLLHWGLAPSDCCSRVFDPQTTHCLGHQVWTPLCFHHPGHNISARMA